MGGVEEDEVGEGAWGQGAEVGAAEDAGGVCAHQGYDFCEGQADGLGTCNCCGSVGRSEGAEGQAEGGFEAGDAVGGSLELDFLFPGGVGGVVGGDAVDGFVEEGFEDGVAVGGGAEGWVHLGVGVVGADGVFGEEEVVGGRFGGDVEALAFGFTDEVDGTGGRDVLDV